MNLGGGYYLGPETDTSPLEQVVGRLHSDYGVRVFIEPGTALTQQAGFLVSEALDVFRNDGADIVVMDATTKPPAGGLRIPVHSRGQPPGDGGWAEDKPGGALMSGGGHIRRV